MNMRPLTQWTLYKYRFAAAYTLLAVTVGLLFLMFPNHIPGGLAATEQRSVVTSAAVTFTALPLAVVDLPYHILQKVSVEFLGVTPLGVRLPSLIFGSLTALCMALILRRWFKPHIALLAAVIAVTSGWLISMSRFGAPLVMVPFWTSLLILCATHVSQQSRGWKAWKILLALTAALSLYTPFMMYLFITAFLATTVQPHLRYLVRESGAFTITIGLLCFLILLVPLGWGVYHNLGVLRELAAIPAQLPDPMVFLRGLFDAFNNLLNPFNISFGETITPALSAVSGALLIMGGVRLLSDFHSVRAYVLLIWAAVLIPVIGLNPTNLTMLYVPAMLVCAIGLHLIIQYWYRLFPRNPYARLFGFIPLIVLIVSIVQLNYQRYTYGTLYSEQATNLFKPDAFMAQRYITSVPATTPLTVVVNEADKPLYQAMLPHRPSAKVITAAEAVSVPGTWLVAHAERPKIGATVNTPPKTLLVSDRKDNALSFWVYQQ